MTTAPSKLDMLFIAEHAFWPLDQGCRLHGYQWALAAARNGARVGVACMEPLPASAPEALRQLTVPWPTATDHDVTDFERGWSGPGRWMRHRIANHQGLDPRVLAGVVTLVKRHAPRSVHGVGQHSVLMLRGLSHLRDAIKIWHGADELVYFNLSCMRREPFAALPLRLRTLALHAALENVFCRGIDAALGVSPLDSRLLRWIAGAKNVMTIRNGVDLDYFTPRRETPEPFSVAFWGRMDFEPNIDAARWFAKHVWPLLLARHPNAAWHIVGKNPSPAVMALGKSIGVTVHGEVADIRAAVGRASVAILPMRCGGGIKNKLLEAAAMGLPIVASPHAVQGLDLGPWRPPLGVCRRPGAWVAAITGLWNDETQASLMGRRARAWVKMKHSWDGAAQQMAAWLSRWPNPGGVVEPPASEVERQASIEAARHANLAA